MSSGYRRLDGLGCGCLSLRGRLGTSERLSHELSSEELSRVPDIFRTSDRNRFGETGFEIDVEGTLVSIVDDLDC